jgi:hypothetical protein
MKPGALTPRLRPACAQENAVLLEYFSNHRRGRVDTVLALRLCNHLRFRFLRIHKFQHSLLSPDDVGLSAARFWDPPA